MSGKNNDKTLFHSRREDFRLVIFLVCMFWFKWKKRQNKNKAHSILILRFIPFPDDCQFIQWRFDGFLVIKTSEKVNAFTFQQWTAINTGSIENAHSMLNIENKYRLKLINRFRWTEQTVDLLTDFTAINPKTSSPNRCLRNRLIIYLFVQRS